MKLIDFVKESSFDEVWDEMKSLYSSVADRKEVYENIFNYLKTAPEVDCDLTMFLRFETDSDIRDYDFEVHCEIYGLKEGDDEDSYALDLLPWKEWAHMEVDCESFNLIADARVFIAHCLWGMSAYGDTEEIVQSTIDVIESRIKSIDGGTAEMLSWEEVKDNLRERFPDVGF